MIECGGIIGSVKAAEIVLPSCIRVMATVASVAGLASAESESSQFEVFNDATGATEVATSTTSWRG